MMKILAIPGSLRANSSSNKILSAIASIMPPGIQFTVYDGVGNLPHFNDSAESPAAVSDFRKLIQDSDAVLICQPEYAFGVAGSLKNALDWTVSSGDFVDKPVALITAATGGENAHAAMLLTLTAMSSRILHEACLVISFIKSRLDADGKISDKKTKQDLQSAVDNFVKSILSPSRQGDTQA